NSSQKIVLQNSSQNSSNYLYKEKFQNLLTIEDGFYDPKPYRAVQKIFPPNWHFKPWSLSKPYEYYENILTETQSIRITHHYTNPNEPLSYSTTKILKIIHPMDWAKKNQFLSHHQKFQNRITTMDLCPTYSYWDYQQAWYNIFFIQNKMGYHSWLIYFENRSGDYYFPNWFIQWWDWFGPTTQILQYPTDEGFELFKAYYQPTEIEKSFSPLTIFTSKFFVPWVLQWEYDYFWNNGIPTLIRKFKVKWWDKFAKAENSSPDAILEWFQQNKGALKSERKDNSGASSSNTAFLAEKSKITALLAGEMNQEKYYELIAQLAQTVSSSQKTDSSHTSEESVTRIASSDPDDNEDDCYGVLPPIK